MTSTGEVKAISCWIGIYYLMSALPVQFSTYNSQKNKLPVVTVWKKNVIFIDDW